MQNFRKTLWVNCSFKVDYCYQNQGLTNLHCFKGSKYHDIFLICAHMARYPYFPASRKMCLMGDIKMGAYYSSWYTAHVSIGIIRILAYVFYETLDSHYKRILAFWHKNIEVQLVMGNNLFSEGYETWNSLIKTANWNIFTSGELPVAKTSEKSFHQDIS